MAHLPHSLDTIPTCGRIAPCVRMAECLLSETKASQRYAELFAIAPNPFEQGRKNQIAMWRRSWRDLTRSLVWC